jgi:hypothetical protein
LILVVGISETKWAVISQMMIAFTYILRPKDADDAVLEDSVCILTQDTSLLVCVLSVMVMPMTRIVFRWDMMVYGCLEKISFVSCVYKNITQIESERQRGKTQVKRK